MAVDEVVRPAFTSLESQNSVPELREEAAEGILGCAERACLNLNHAGALVDDCDLRRARVGAPGENIHRMGAAAHLVAKLANIDVHAAAVTGAGAGEGRSVDGDNRYVAHASDNDNTIVKEVPIIPTRGELRLPLEKKAGTPHSVHSRLLHPLRGRRPILRPRHSQLISPAPVT